MVSYGSGWWGYYF